MSTSRATELDFDGLLAFDAVARERNMRKAAQTLNITQPPLSRKIQRLEAQLGVVLFERHSDGVELTNAGIKLLDIIRPFLQHADNIAESISNLCETNNNYSIGLSTAFDQSIYSYYIDLWKTTIGGQNTLVRKESPKLVKDVITGKLTCAFVALPIEASDIIIFELGYSERMWAFMPESWNESSYPTICLKQLNGNPMFWFQRKRNTSYFDYMRSIFNANDFLPIFIEEPQEFDVLLSRISSGEGFVLLPESFTKVNREGIKPIKLENYVNLSLGFICKDKKHFIFPNQF